MSVCLFFLPGLWKAKVRAHPNTRKTVDHLLYGGGVWEVEHDCSCGAVQRNTQLYYRLFSQSSSVNSSYCQWILNKHVSCIFIIKTLKRFYNNKVKWLHIGNCDCCLTSVGHEYFQSCILQQVTSGKDSTDLCEQPFSMKTIRIRQNLEDRTGKATPKGRGENGKYKWNNETKK